ncbi:MAG TPA: glycosyltransferase family 4 protein [Gammaproteobacteria bacterium]|nr:glycosyltransferase family 4 protein [Gammaproteobacteria bacterium]
MKIAQIAPLIESVPPRLYGGTERIVSYLTEELVRKGHDVTLFASGDSQTAARLVAVAPRALRLEGATADPLPYIALQLEQVRQRAAEFDVLHFHSDLIHLPLLRELLGVRALTTLHGRLDQPPYPAVLGEFHDAPLVSISNAQRQPVPSANWLGTVYHGLPRSVCPFEARPRGDYVAFIGRISPEKRPDRAIEIAARAGVKLKIAAKIDERDQAYFHKHIEPLFGRHHVEYIGEIGERDKAAFLGNARALLFPIDWPEPFGLVLVEAMSCGTPCIAWRTGSIPEVIDDGVTGWIVDSIEEAARAVSRAAQLDRYAVRARFLRRFSVERMTSEYLRIYEKLDDVDADRAAA